MADLRFRLSRTPIAFAIVGQSNQRGQVSPTETIGGMASRTAFPQAFASLRNPGVRYPVGPAGSLNGGYHFKIYDDLWDWGYNAQMVNASIGSMSMLRDAAGQILDIAGWRSQPARQQRAADVPGDRGYIGDYGVASGKVFVCTTGRRAYAFHQGTFLPNDSGVNQNLDFIREVGTNTTAASAPDFSAATVGSTVADGTVTWTCVSVSTTFLGYTYGPGACSETRAGFDPFGILRRCHEEMARIRSARERIIILCNGQSDTGQTSGLYQGAINSVASFFANRGYTVHLGLAEYSPAGGSTAGYETLSAALASSYTFLTGAFSATQIKQGPNLYQLMGSTGDMAAGGANFVKDSGQDNIHQNARGAIEAGRLVANSVKAWLPQIVDPAVVN
ncbi:hypothetical protein [Sphingomonas sp. CCH9-F2]|jgi:hypothetical protein|uniref:hypothetical protein n=1 Tax=Sphingomonas sp. CCH9-F2 TaxID=1768778 RepID=UPI00082E1B2A|nr:hypothetical protein [Sphingomonas sp. CCH9-F2]